MRRIKATCAQAWSGYCWECDRSRVDEVPALLGGLVAGVLGLLALICVLSFAMLGRTVTGIPLLAVALWMRSRR